MYDVFHKDGTWETTEEELLPKLPEGGMEVEEYERLLTKIWEIFDTYGDEGLFCRSIVLYCPNDDAKKEEHHDRWLARIESPNGISQYVFFPDFPDAAVFLERFIPVFGTTRKTL